MNKLPNHTALKEWSSVVDALGRGEQVILVRKGGVADPAFGIEADRFYLYPTYFHQGEPDPRPSVTVTHWCEIARTWLVRDPGTLPRLAPLVVVPRESLETRYRFRPDQALCVIGVRTWTLPAPVEVLHRDAYAGCLSWISLEEEIDVDGSLPVLSEGELAARLDEVASLLALAV